ncbi:GspH/FimT family pseudopilin [Uliginosibacterium sp. 31-12]|uniref:GspH/FimT family pseudopilin n=1 Tax=Uliginosibacterium sp. 31-12 TaxID=3062781 RepID=UPI0026E43845|nr:GspH/FimT family pseudopilin [Uliginosibacterium sp. 31-12]MDO6386582.1 GspH/FimT family pseudopilin [Uliginosibacterium sp. 31-12]
MLRPHCASRRGFSLIELMVIIAVMSILTLVAVPNLSTWLANNRVRTVAEALQNALRQAQVEAIKRSRQTSFVLTAASPALSATPSSSGPNWYIQSLPLTGSSEAASNTDFVRGETLANQYSVSISGGNAALCFNSAGRLVSNTATGLGASCTAPADSVTYTLTTTGADRKLAVQVYAGGKVRMCDPQKTLSVSNPDGCTTS